jgi:hypothetical protein
VLSIATVKKWYSATMVEHEDMTGVDATPGAITLSFDGFGHTEIGRRGGGGGGGGGRRGGGGGGGGGRHRGGHRHRHGGGGGWGPGYYGQGFLPYWDDYPPYGRVYFEDEDEEE